MKLSLAAAALLIASALTLPAYADAATADTPAPAAKAAHIAKTKQPHRTAKAPRTSHHEVTYDRDSKDPNIG